MKVAIATENPVKTDAVRQAFGEVLGLQNVEIDRISLQLDVPEQPLGEAIAFGASTRAHAALEHSQADVGVGIEAGLMQVPGTETWISVQICVLVDAAGTQAMGMGPGFELPGPIRDAVLAGEPLRGAFERVLGVEDPQRQGAIHYLSNGAIDRMSLTLAAVRMALVPWMNEEGP